MTAFMNRPLSEVDPEAPRPCRRRSALAYNLEMIASETLFLMLSSSEGAGADNKLLRAPGKRYYGGVVRGRCLTARSIGPCRSSFANM